jgi:hypothetical protein
MPCDMVTGPTRNLLLYTHHISSAAAFLQEVTWALKQRYPGRFLSAEITPEDPKLMAEYGFDAIWVHSGKSVANVRHIHCCFSCFGSC